MSKNAQVRKRKHNVSRRNSTSSDEKEALQSQCADLEKVLKDAQALLKIVPQAQFSGDEAFILWQSLAAWLSSFFRNNR